MRKVNINTKSDHVALDLLALPFLKTLFYSAQLVSILCWPLTNTSFVLNLQSFFYRFGKQIKILLLFLIREADIINKVFLISFQCSYPIFANFYR